MTLRTPELDEIIVSGISEGIPLRQLARLHGFSKTSFYNWCQVDNDLAGRIARARELGFDAIAEEALDIADDGSNDWMEREGGPALNAEHVQRSKLRIETRLKLLAKWSPDRYGDRVNLNHSGGVTVVGGSHDEAV